MESLNKQPYEISSNFDINTAAELLTSLQHGKTETVDLVNKGKSIVGENVNMELHPCPTNENEEISNKLPTEQKRQRVSPNNQDSCSNTTKLNKNQEQPKVGQENGSFYQPSKSVVSTPVRKRTRPVTGFEGGPPSIQKRQQRVSNMFAFEWAILQQLKWCQSKETNYGGWLSPLPYYQNLWTEASVAPKQKSVTNPKESPKSCKGRPPSELPLSRMRFKALQQACVDRGISPNGTVAALKQRLRDWISIKMTGKPFVPQPKKRRIENDHSSIQDYKTV
ncbi:hypothetical protein GpartN1_g6567.t1 [Galdieria partita]|uniref:SAP domain-containing protein n=1 Tax=Galdieria partita TaxID=83374 RepID=A0A9C7Q3K5_9RHOD|nr:hypothetical protein GpartN1_g6567.t1 [Galdieria partita]